jgi:cell wall-associated NlpC family hydrolase
VWRGLYGAEPEAPPPYRPDWAEMADGEPLLEALGRWFEPVPVGAAEAGDVLAFRMAPAAAAKHLAILSGPSRACGSPGHLPAERGEDAGRILHAYWGRAVVESWMQPWWRRRVVAAYRWPAVVSPRCVG